MVEVVETVRLRGRGDSDLRRCAALLRSTHESDRYPLHMPDDPASFFVVRDAMGAWVALVDDEIVGHVLLRAASTPTVMAVASGETGLAEDRLAVVGRLLVGRSARRRGVGRALLGRAARESWALGRQPVLDVVTDQTAAIALYEREGWRKAAQVRVTFSTGESVDEIVFIGPPDSDS
jgi:GNAT superfamily N-acetyltransferase